MRIFIASDHAGFLLKRYLLESIENIEDLGTYSAEPCDYPVFADKMASEICKTGDCRGILICGTGIGMSIASNRYSGIRAALCFNEKMAEMSRRHNDANIIIFGASVIDAKTSLRCVKIFMEAPFDGGRHERRINLISGGLK